MMDSPAARLFEQMNKTAATTLANATNTSTRSAAGNVGTDVSYNNMYYMNMVNVALLGEIVGNARAAEMGYRLIDNWLQYEQTADLHEFTSPTYYWVQVNSLYMGYLYAKRAGAKAVFKVRRNGASALLLAAALLRVTHSNARRPSSTTPGLTSLRTTSSPLKRSRARAPGTTTSSTGTGR